MRNEHRPRTQNKKALYQQYLASSAWKAKREAVLKRDGYKCRTCGRCKTPLKPFVRLEVHHLYYSNSRAEETIEQLITLCAQCHAAHHGKQSKTIIRKTVSARKTAKKAIRHKIALHQPDHDAWLAKMEAEIAKEERDAMNMEKKNHPIAEIVQ